MSDSFLIDGYNLIHALGMISKHVGPGGLETARTWLLDFLAEAFGDDARQVTIVFDAKHAPRGVARQQEHRGLHVDFAPKGLSADDRIEDLIGQSGETERLVVVSNDTRIQNDARRKGARAWSHDDLLEFIETRVKPPAGEPQADDDRGRKVSAEELKAWLKEFGAVEKDTELREFFETDRFE